MDSQRTQRRAAVIGLAVAATVSVASVTFTRLHAEDISAGNAPARPLSLADAASGDIDLLKQGLNQYKNKQYEEAKATLGQINAAGLSASDQKKLTSAQTDVDSALAGRQEARETFTRAEAALAAGKLDEAKSLYKSSADAKFADDATRQKAKEQIALVNAMQDQKAAELAAEYQQAKKDFEAGDYAAAKAKFQALDAAGYKAPLFQTSPKDFVAKVDAKAAAADQTAEKTKAEADTQAADAQAKADKATADAKAKEDEKAAKEAKAAEKAKAEADAKAAETKAAELYTQGQSALKAGDFATARTSFKAADEAGFKPGLFQAPAAKMLAEVDKAEAKSHAEADQAAAKQKEADAKAQADAEKAAAKQKDAEAKAQAEADHKKAEVDAKAAETKAAELYAQGQAALKANDFDTARTSFKAADEAGFKPGLFQAPAAKMLAEVDTAEAKQKETAAKTQADADATAAKQKDIDAKAQAEADHKKAEADAKAQKEAAEAQAKADAAAATTRQVAAREQYKTGLAALKTGDFAAARTSFKAADEAGFKPGLFEAPAAKMLAEVDKDEADAKAKAEKLAAHEAEKAQKAQAEADRKAAEAKAKADKAAADAQAKAAETKPEVKTEAAAPAVVAPVAPVADATTPETKAEGTTPAFATKAEAKAADTAEAKAPEAKAVEPVAATPTAKAELENTAKMDQIRAQAKAYDAQRLVDQARAAEKEGKIATALELYTKAVDTDPSNQAAVDGRNQMLTLQGRPAVPASMLDQQASTNKARKESITFSFNDAIDKARAATASNDFKTAEIQINSAAIARNQDANLFSADEVKAFDTTLAEVRQQMVASQQAFDRAAKQRAADQAQEAERNRNAIAARERQETVSALIKDTRQYLSQNRYRDALATCDQILQVDPTNEYARGVRPLIEERALIQEQRGYREEFNRQWVRSLVSAEEERIPYGDIYRYPTNWPDITESRDRIVEQERGIKESDRLVQAALDKRLPEVKFDGAPFEDVVEFLRDMTGTNIFVNWKALDQVPVDRKAPVTTRLRDVKFAKVLQTVLDSVSTDPNNKLTYTVDEGVITISTTSDVSSRVVTRVYDITDLIISSPSIDAGNNSFGGNSGSNNNSNNSGGSSSGNRSGGGGGGVFGGGGGGNRSSGGSSNRSSSSSSNNSSSSSNSSSNSNSSSSFDRQGAVQDVSTLIQDTVATDTWADTGTGRGSIRASPLNQAQQLIITQTPEVHRQIEGLLAQLRESLAIQVTVETRFLTISRNYMEDFGLDLNAVFNPNPGNGSNWSPIPVTQNSSAFTANPSTSIPGSIGSEGIAPSLTSSGTYIDQFQVNFVVRATQASVHSSVVTAPRVTVYNGGEAQVTVTTDTSYVSNLEPQVASGVVGYNATISTATDGVTLYVRANVSADRKYVTLYLQPSLQKLLALVPFTFQQATTIPSGGSNNNVYSQGSLTIQEPRTQNVNVTTLVSVPDGGTLLLGGQTLAGEEEREAGVPVLSKIPVLKRLFTNRSTAKDEQVLLILVKPTIIIQKEQEQKQFPLLSSKISGS